MDREFLKLRAGSVIDEVSEGSYYWNIFLIDSGGYLIAEAEKRGFIRSSLSRYLGIGSGSFEPEGRSVRETLETLSIADIRRIANAVMVMNDCVVTVFKLPADGGLEELLTNAHADDERALAIAREKVASA